MNSSNIAKFNVEADGRCTVSRANGSGYLLSGTFPNEASAREAFDEVSRRAAASGLSFCQIPHGAICESARRRHGSKY